MKILILGYSSIAKRRIIPALNKLNVIQAIDVGSCSTPNHKKRKNSKIHKIFENYSDALAQSDADIVYISTINSLHEKLAEASLLSGRHVIVDKPAFLNFPTTKRITSLAKKLGLGVAETTVFPFHPQFKCLKELAKKYSPIESIVTTFTMPPFPSENYRWNKKLGGGAIHDLGPYAAAMGRLFFKHPPSFLVSRITKKDNNTQIDTAFSLLATFKNNQNLAGTFGFSSEYINSLLVYGPNCSINIQRIFSPPPNLKNKIIIHHKNSKIIKFVPAGDSFLLMINAIINDFLQNKFDQYSNWMLNDSEMRDKIRLSAETRN